MAQIVMNGVDESTFAKLANLAATNQLSVEDLAKKLLVDAVDTLARRRNRLETADHIAAMTPCGIAQTRDPPARGSRSMTLVVDASVAVKWLVDEPGRPSARALLDQVVTADERLLGKARGALSHPRVYALSRFAGPST
jgi:plasmid stability protein